MATTHAFNICKRCTQEIVLSTKYTSYTVTGIKDYWNYKYSVF